MISCQQRLCVLLVVDGFASRAALISVRKVLSTSVTELVMLRQRQNSTYRPRLISLAAGQGSSEPAPDQPLRDSETAWLERGVQVRQATLTHHTARAVLEEAENAQADAIAVAAPPRALEGSCSASPWLRKVIAAGRQSVLVARPDANIGLGPIVLLFDSPKRFALVLRLLARLNPPPGTELILCAFVEPLPEPAPYAPSYVREIRIDRQVERERVDFRRMMLKGPQEELAHAGFRTHVHVELATAVSGVRRVVEKADASLLIIGGEGRERRPVLALADPLEVTSRAPCSVLVAR
jgi:hypothetical protein